MATRTIQLYAEYAEYGHQGSKEVNKTYTLAIDGASRVDFATLEVEQQTDHFPDDGFHQVEKEHFQINVELLVQLIRAHGTQLP